jgi:hypothetical protein
VTEVDSPFTHKNYFDNIITKGKRRLIMNTLKQEALAAIAQLPETSDIDTMMYNLYVIDKVIKGKEAVEKGETISAEDLKREIESW